MITNPATELHDLCVSLRGTSDTQKPTGDVLAGLFACKNSDPLFFAILGALGARFERLRQIVKASENVPEHLRPTALQAINHLWKIFSTQLLTTRWDQGKKQIFLPAHLTAMQFLGPLVEHEAPLKKITKEECAELVKQIDDAIANIEGHKCNSFAKDAIVMALTAVKKTLERFEFFGIDAVTEKLVLAHAGLSSGMAEAAHRRDRRGASAFKKAIVAVSAVAGALILADNALDAIEDHYSRGQTLIRYIADAAPVEIKALPAPAPDEPQGLEQPEAQAPADDQTQASGKGKSKAIVEEPEPHVAAEKGGA